MERGTQLWVWVAPQAPSALAHAAEAVHRHAKRKTWP